MNVNDAKAPEANGCRLRMIFDRQKELMDKYHGIEKKNGIGLGAIDGEFDIDHPKWQYLLKDYAWRVTEEIAESTEAVCNRNDQDHDIHAWEEAVDAIHFLVELCLIIGLDLPTVIFNPEEFKNMTDEPDVLSYICKVGKDTVDRELLSHSSYMTIEYLGKAMNCLKNKPWKQSQMETDVMRFHGNIKTAFIRLIWYCVRIGMDAQMIFEIYFKKSEVNKFRQRSLY